MCVIHPVDAAFLYACMYAVQLFALAVVRMHAPVPFGDTLLFLQVVLVCSDGDGFVNKVLSLVVLSYVLAQTITFQLV